MKEHSQYISYKPLRFTEAEALERSTQYLQLMQVRRSQRAISSRPVERKIIENLILTASSAPSGANKQPWFFCAISSSALKQKIRSAAEREEYENYHGRMSQEWLKDLEVFETNWKKEFLEQAPWLIVVFRKTYDLDEIGQKHKNYYVHESVGIACGFLLSAIHQAGLVSLTHTPSPMGFLQQLLHRPENEKPYLLIPVGWPVERPTVPDIRKKELGEISLFFE
jgi:iodotyrosine deiodinase